MTYLRDDCFKCVYWKWKENFCSAISHGMSCVYGPLPERRGIAERISAVVTANAVPPPANATQVGGEHYKKMGVQVWDVVDTWPLDQRVGYYRGNALKYLMRMGSKDQSAQEIAKGKHYMEKLLEVLTAEPAAVSSVAGLQPIKWAFGDPDRRREERRK